MTSPDTVTNIASFVESRTERNVEDENIIQTNPEAIHELQLQADDNSSNDSETEADDSEEVMNQFVMAMDNFKAKVVTSYQNTLKKGVKYFTKKLQKFSKQNEKTLEKSLFSIGKEISKQKVGGKKRKMGKLIPIQVTAKSRREYKHRGRVLATSGRRPIDQSKRVQMVVGEKDENVYHSLPRQKKTKNKQIHSLKHSVEMNTPAAKKH